MPDTKDNYMKDELQPIQNELQPMRNQSESNPRSKGWQGQCSWELLSHTRVNGTYCWARVLPYRSSAFYARACAQERGVA